MHTQRAVISAHCWASLVAERVKNLLAMQDTPG